MRLPEALNIKEELEASEPLVTTLIRRAIQRVRDWFRLVVEFAFH